MTPTTMAGRALLEFWRLHRTAMHAVPYDYADAIEDDILAIETEAAAEAEALRAALDSIRDLCLTALETPITPSDEQLHRMIVAQVEAALATPAPAAPAVIRHGDEHDDPDGYCGRCSTLRIGPYAPAAPAECAHRLITFTHPGCIGCGRLLERESLTEDTARVFTPAEPEATR